MATTSNSGSGQKQSASSSSRFASLKVFKFATVSSKNSPPVPPPKEKPPTNISLVSLTSESSIPTTPLSPNYSRSQSTPPYPTTHSPASSSQDPTSASTATSFGKGLIKFAKRSLTPKHVARQLSESSEDSSISLPWNFQVCFISDLVFFRFLPPILYFRESNFQSLGFRLLTHFYLCLCPIFGVHYSTICMLTKGELSRSFRYSHPIRTNGRECGALSKS